MVMLFSDFAVGCLGSLRCVVLLFCVVGKLWVW